MPRPSDEIDDLKKAIEDFYRRYDEDTKVDNPLKDTFDPYHDSIYKNLDDD